MKKILCFVAIVSFHLASAQQVSAADSTSVHSLHNLAGIDVKPDFPGGLQAFYQYIASTFKLPAKTGLNGNVFVTFVIEKDGAITDIKVLRDIGFGTGKEAVRVLHNSPKWIPGE